MKKINEYNFSIKDGDILIRSIKNSDLSFYKNWFKKGHILEDKVNTISENEIDCMMFSEIKMFLILIIETNEKPMGEITIWNDKSIIFQNKTYKKPFYSIGMKFYENIPDNEIDKVLKLFINSIKVFKMKNGTMFATVDESIKENYKNNYISNGFAYLDKEFFKTKLEKFFIKNGINNPYETLKLFIKEM